MPITVNVPDSDPIEFPNALGVAEVRRVLVTMGYTQVEGASAEVDDDGNITFARQAGGAKAA
jgi:hypothetical protein